jgi:hypothetical protein
MIQTNRSGLAVPGLLSAAASLAVIGCGRGPEPPDPPAAVSSEWREFEGTWNATGTRRTIPLGADRRASILDLSGTMLLSGTARPGVGFRAEVIALGDSETGLTGRGVWTDDRGDRVFSELVGDGTSEDNRIVGTIFGGTGRYRGATGTYGFSWQYVIEAEEGVVQGRAMGLKGRFRLGDPGAEGETGSGGAGGAGGPDE